MPDSELAIVATQTFPVPILIERAGPSTRKKFFEFFTVPIRNANTRAAFYRAIHQFLSWCERAGYQDLEEASDRANPREEFALGIHPNHLFCSVRTLNPSRSRPTSRPCSARRRLDDAPFPDVDSGHASVFP